MRAGIDVTHLDAHMGCALSPEFCDIYIRLGLEYRLPILLTSTIAAYTPNDNLVGVTEEAHRKGVDKARASGFEIFDAALQTTWGRPRSKPAEPAYRAIVESVKEGLTFFCLHFNAPGELELIEPRAAYIRTEEYDVFRSERFSRLAAGTGSRHHRHEARCATNCAPSCRPGKELVPGKRPEEAHPFDMRASRRAAPRELSLLTANGRLNMKLLAKLALAALVSASFFTGAAQAANLKEAKDVRIMFVVHGSPADPYWSVVKRGVDDAAKLTGATVEYHNPQVFDVVEQARLMEAAVASKPDGIAVSIADADAMRKSVQAALAANIPVVVVDSGELTGEEMGTTLYVGTVSEYDSGKKAGERLAKDGILKVVCINHEVGNISLDDRCRGLNDGLKPSGGGTEVVAVTPDPADITRRTEAYLSAHADVQAVFCMGAGACNPLIPMFRDKELFGKLKLYTFDISPEVLDSVIAGEMGFGMDAQQYLMGFLPVIYMVENATHGFWPINDSYTGPLFIDTPAKAQAMLGLAKDGIR